MNKTTLLERETDDDDGKGSFSEERSPGTVVIKCKNQWTLHVTVKKHRTFPADRIDITIRLERIGYYTGLAKGTTLTRKLTSDEVPLSRDFTGVIDERYWIDVAVGGDDWFNWTSERKDVWIKRGEEKSVEIEIRPHLLFVSMSDLSKDSRARVQGSDGAATYGLTKTVTGSEILAVLGEGGLRTGHVDPAALAANAPTLASMLGFRAPPYFSVVDLNLSHQMTFFLACLAFHQHGRHKSKLVLNFDNHADYGSSGKTVSYDKWGAGFFEHAEVLRDVIGAQRVVYTILGEAQIEANATPLIGSMRQLYHSDRARDGQPHDWTAMLGSAYFRTSPPLVVARRRKEIWRLEHAKREIVDADFDEADLQELRTRGVLQLVSPDTWSTSALKAVLACPPGQHDASTFRTANQTLLASLDGAVARTLDLNACGAAQILDDRYLDDLSKTDVYITIDRDVTQKSFTYWGDGFLSCDEMRSAVDRCLTYLESKGANLVGFDLCGVPDSTGMSRMLGISDRSAGPGQYEAAILKQAKDDIAHFAQRVRAYRHP